MTAKKYKTPTQVEKIETPVEERQDDWTPDEPEVIIPKVKKTPPKPELTNVVIFEHEAVIDATISTAASLPVLKFKVCVQQADIRTGIMIEKLSKVARSFGVTLGVKSKVAVPVSNLIRTVVSFDTALTEEQIELLRDVK